MSTRDLFRPLWLLLVSCSGLSLLAIPAAAQTGQAMHRARMLRTVSLLRRQAGPRIESTPVRAARPARATGTIAGTLSGLDDDGFPSALVMAWDSDVPGDALLDFRDLAWHSEVPDSPVTVVMVPLMPDGAYRLEGLPAGNYFVTASAKGYLDKHYDNVTELSRATPVAVLAGETTTGIDFAMERLVPGTGSIAGTVRSAVDGRSLAGATVHAFSVDNPFAYGMGRTNRDGAYAISGLAGGRYFVEVWADGYLPAFYDGAGTFAEATPVEVVEPGETGNIDFRLVMGGSIAGYVYSEDGVPLAGAYIQITSSMPVWEWGDSVIGDDGQWGTLPDGEAGEGIAPEPMPPPRTPTHGWAVTDERGFYRAGGLETGSYYVMAQVSTRWSFAWRWYDGVEDYEKATPVAVMMGEETGRIDFVLPAPAVGSAIAGRVIDAQGQPLAGAFVTVQNAYDSMLDHPRESYIWAYATTDRDGQYRVEELPAGEYLVLASSQRGWEYVQRWYPDAASPEEARPVRVGSNQVVDGIDLILPVQAGTASLSGVVRDAEGNPLPWAFVQVTPVDDDPTRAASLWAYGQTDREGAYRVTQLPAGAYVVHASYYGDGDRYGQGWYDGADSPETATPVSLADGGARSGIDFRLVVRPLYGTVSGMVTDADTGAPVARAYVELAPLKHDLRLAAPTRFFTAHAVTDAQGRFEIGRVTEGQYVLSVYADGAFAQYVDPHTDALVTPFQVAGGQTVTCDVALPRPRDGEQSIAGTVTVDFDFDQPPPRWSDDLPVDADSAPGGTPEISARFWEGGGPLEFAVVVATPLASPDIRYTAITSPDGAYLLRGLPAGEYVVMSFAPYHLGQYYDRVYAPEDATPIQVDGQRLVREIDFALSPAYYLGRGPEAPASDSSPAIAVYGKVTDEQGRGIEGAAVYLLDQSERPVVYGNTGPDGSFGLSGLAPGGYRLRASKLGFTGGYNGGARTFAEADVLPLAGGQRQVDLVLSPDRSTDVQEPDSPALPLALALDANYPNPFNPSTQIAFTVPETGRARVEVFNALGQQVAVLFDQPAQAGYRYQVEFQAGGLASGIYLYTLQFDGRRLTRAMLLLR